MVEEAEQAAADAENKVHKLHEIRQSEGGQMTLALVQGETVEELPKDLYIPPHALEVFLEAFEGPLDLLLQLITSHQLDIAELSLVEIVESPSLFLDGMSGSRLPIATLHGEGRGGPHQCAIQFERRTHAIVNLFTYHSRHPATGFTKPGHLAAQGCGGTSGK